MLPDDKALREKLAEVLYGQPSGEEIFACRFHPESLADGACRKCGAPLCAACFGESWPRLYCGDCRRRMTQVNLLKASLKSLKFPVMWVLICVVISGVAYAAGVGRPSMKAIIAADVKYAWYRQEAPQLLVAEGARQRRRAVALDMLGRTEQAKEWNARATESFTRAGELWKETPVGNSIAIAVARTYADNGNYRKAAAVLESLKPDEKDPAFLAHLYYLGLYLEKLGETEAALRSFDRAYSGATQVSAKSLDNLLDRVLNDRNEAARVLKVSLACDAAMSPEQVRELLKDRDLPSMKDDFFRPMRTAPEPEAPPPPEKKKKEAKAPEYQVEKVQ
jgi:hypothetical protein